MGKNMKTEIAVTKSTAAGYRVRVGNYRFIILRSRGTKVFAWRGFHYRENERCPLCHHEHDPPAALAGRCGVYAVLNIIPGRFGIYVQVDKPLT